MAQTNTDPRREVHVLIWTTVLLFLVVLAVGGWAYVDSSSKRGDIRALALQAKRQATLNASGTSRIHLALCALRSDLDRRADSGEREVRRSRAFLAAHPDGIPGIPASLIRQGIRDKQNLVTGQRSSIKVLSVLACAPVTIR